MKASVLFMGLALALSSDPSQKDGGPPEVSPSQPISSRPLSMLVKAYQCHVSPHLGDRCRFEPSCSAYCLEVAETRGLGTVLIRTSDRLQRCHPWADDYYETSQEGRLLDPYPDRPPKGGLWRRAGRSLCSALVPGLGQALEGRWKDGLVALGFVAIPGTVAACLAHETPEIASLPLAVSAFFYLGNISSTYHIPPPDQGDPPCHE